MEGLGAAIRELVAKLPADKFDTEWPPFLLQAIAYEGSELLLFALVETDRDAVAELNGC